MSDHVTVNRDYWNGMAQDWVAGGEHAWASDRVAPGATGACRRRSCASCPGT
jgi:hypothetical protein